MSLLAFFEQLAESSWSASIHESEIAYSIIESVHVWSLCLFFGLAVIFDLRLLGGFSARGSMTSATCPLILRN
jgi:hypothetical protein